MGDLRPDQIMHKLLTISKCFISLAVTLQYVWKFFLVYWPNFYLSAKLGNWIRVHSSLHSRCHHQNFFVNFDLKICYRPQYSRQVGHFKEAETGLIRKTLNDFNWERGFTNTNVNGKVCIFNKSVLNVLSIFIPHETILCNNKDPQWFNCPIKSLS